jgi:thiamine biosynthesis protein ThiI
MHPSGGDVVLVRYGEIGVKSRQVQARMESHLQKNLQRQLEDRSLPADVEREHTRLYVHTEPDAIEAVTETATETFGVVSASPAHSVEPTMDAICTELSEMARDQYDGGSFAVRARRAGDEKTHPFASTDIEREGGTAVWKAAESEGVEPRVDLDDPDLTFYVECRPHRAFVFVEKRDGPGGLPLGTQEPVVALVSGGIDSPVAAWEVMKRGCPVYPLYVDLGDYGGVDHRVRAEETVARLQRYVPGAELPIRIAPGGPGFDRIVEAVETARMLVVRRYMLRIATHVADELDAVGIVTGESIGQKSSQTSAGLRVTSAVTEYPVHRPLVSIDKTTITERAKRIGTYEQATIDAGCNRLAPETPATRPPLSTVRDAEPTDVARLAREAADGIDIAQSPLD